MFNIDQAAREFKEKLKQDGFIEQPRRPIHFKIKEFKRTRSIALACEIIDDLENYHILDNDEFETLTNLASEAQAVKLKQKQAARRTNTNITPQKLSERNRKAAIARWNKVKESNLIKEVK